MAAAEKKPFARLVGVVIELDGVPVTVPWEDVSVYAESHECDICGSHGKVKFTVDLPVGKANKESWVELEACTW